jgi:hypothetical protein
MSIQSSKQDIRRHPVAPLQKMGFVDLQNEVAPGLGMGLVDLDGANPTFFAADNTCPFTSRATVLRKLLPAVVHGPGCG